MGRRTLRQAEAWFEEVSPVLPGETRRQVAEEINEARKRAFAYAEGVAGDHAADVDKDRETTLQELCRIRDGYAQLIKDGQAGKLTATEFTAALNDLEDDERNFVGKVNAFAHKADVVSEIEEAPLDYADDYAERNPGNQFDFTF